MFKGKLFGKNHIYDLVTVLAKCLLEIPATKKLCIWLLLLLWCRHWLQKCFCYRLCYYDYDYGGGRNACIIENIESIHIHKRNEKVVIS